MAAKVINLFARHHLFLFILTLLTPRGLVSAYTFTADGLCVLKNAEMLTDGQLEKYVMGYGWRENSYYEMSTDGHLMNLGYLTSSTDNYSCWSLEPDKQMVSFYRSYGTAHGFAKVQCSYDSSTGVLSRRYSDPLLTKADGYMQILRIVDGNDQHYMLTLQKLGSKTDDTGKRIPLFAMVVYVREPKEVLDAYKKDAQYSADKACGEPAPKMYEFDVQCSHVAQGGGTGDLYGGRLVPLMQTEFLLTGKLDRKSEWDMACRYYDSIVWQSSSAYLPERYCVYKKDASATPAPVRWTSSFLDKDDRLSTLLKCYKNGHMAYAYMMFHKIEVPDALGKYWRHLVGSAPFEYTACNVLDSRRSFTVAVSHFKTNNITKACVRIRYNAGAKGLGNDNAILRKEADELTALMNNNYEQGTTIGNTVNTYRNKFSGLPEKADLKMYWQTNDTHFALVLNHDVQDVQNCYYYIHAEPK